MAINTVQPIHAKNIHICTYNTRTLFNEHLDNLLEELDPSDPESEMIRWDIIGFSETKLKGTFNETVRNNHILFNSGIDDNTNMRRRDGVGFLVHKKTY